MALLWLRQQASLRVPAFVRVWLLAALGLFAVGYVSAAHHGSERPRVAAVAESQGELETDATSSVESAPAEEIEDSVAPVALWAPVLSPLVPAPESGQATWHATRLLGPSLVDHEPNREPPGLPARLG